MQNQTRQQSSQRNRKREPLGAENMWQIAPLRERGEGSNSAFELTQVPAPLELGVCGTDQMLHSMGFESSADTGILPVEVKVHFKFQLK